MDIRGIHHLSLTVTDRVASTAWYREVLGFATHSEVDGPTFDRTRLRHPSADLTLTLTQHDAGPGDRFDPTRPGLDHVAFQLGSTAEVEAAAGRMAELGVDHSPIRWGGEPPARVAILALRDPDGIALELFGLDD